jgi:hypothetical protein
MIAELLEKLHHCVIRLRLNMTESTVGPHLQSIFVNILVQLLAIVSIAAKDLKRGRVSKITVQWTRRSNIMTVRYMKNLLHTNHELAAAFSNLNRLVEEETRAVLTTVAGGVTRAIRGIERMEGKLEGLAVNVHNSKGIKLTVVVD